MENILNEFFFFNSKGRNQSGQKSNKKVRLCVFVPVYVFECICVCLCVFVCVSVYTTLGASVCVHVRVCGGWYSGEGGQYFGLAIWLTYKYRL